MDRDLILNRRGAPVIDRNGDKVGTVDQIYFDNQTRRPQWVAVNSGLFGLRSSFVPLEGARIDGDDVIVAYDKDVVKGAPNISADEQLTPEEERKLYEHYKLAYGDKSELRLHRYTDDRSTV